MKTRLAKIAKWVAYPLFYLFCLAIFGYLTFPFDSLKTRIIAEFDKQQQSARKGRGDGAPMRLEIDELDSYWLSGVEVTGARLIIPPKPQTKRPSPMAFGSAPAKKDDDIPKASEMLIDRVTARVQLLPLLIGDVRVSFDAEAFGGELSGTVPVGADSGEVEVAFEGLQLMDVSPLQDLLEGVPLQGVAAGQLTVAPKEGKFAKADGHLHMTLDTVKLGKKRKNDEGAVEDVVELQGVALPSVVIGTVTIDATIKDGILTIDDFSSKGPDFELAGEGKIKLHETWERSKAEMFLKFKFSDSYRTKSDAATSLLGKPGQNFPPAIEAVPTSPFRRAKTDDDFYRFQISGPLGRVDFKPAGKTAGTSRASKDRSSNPFGGKAASRLKLPRTPRVDPPAADARNAVKEEEEEKEEPAEAPRVTPRGDEGEEPVEPPPSDAEQPGESEEASGDGSEEKDG